MRGEERKGRRLRSTKPRQIHADRHLPIWLSVRLRVRLPKATHSVTDTASNRQESVSVTLPNSLGTGDRIPTNIPRFCPSVRSPPPPLVAGSPPTPHLAYLGHVAFQHPPPTSSSFGITAHGPAATPLPVCLISLHLLTASRFRSRSFLQCRRMHFTRIRIFAFFAMCSSASSALVHSPLWTQAWTCVARLLASRPLSSLFSIPLAVSKRIWAPRASFSKMVGF